MSKLLAFLAAFQFCSIVLALDPNRAITQYVKHSWSIEEGLPQSSVYAMQQTRDGYLWIATGNGLARFDGVRFQVYDSISVPEFTAPEFYSLLESKDGTLWIGSYWGGLVSYKEGKFRKYGKEQGLTDQRVVSIEQDKYGNIWLGTPNGLFRMHDEKFTMFWTKDGLPGRVVWNIVEDHSGVLWIATVGGGLFRYSDGKFSKFSDVDSEDVLELMEDRNGNVWVGTDDGLFLIHQNEVTLYTTKDGLISNVIEELLEDRDGNIWIGTPDGLTRFRDGTFQSIKKQEGWPRYVYTFYEDREGNLWVGTLGEGLYSLRNGKFLTFSTEEGLAGRSVQSVHGNQQGGIWVASDGGISNIKKDQSGRYKVETISTEHDPRCILEDTAGNVWVGLQDQGLWMVKNGKVVRFPQNDQLMSKQLWALYEDVSKNVWLGFFGFGIHRIQNAELKEKFKMEDGLSTSYVTSFSQTDGALLIVTEDGGINRFKDGKFSIHVSHDVLEHQPIAINQDQEGVLWIGSLGGGLKRYKNGKLISIRRRDGLPDDTVGMTVEDSSGNFWVGCNKGIYRIGKKELNDFADGKVSSVHSTLFGKSDGMKSAEGGGGNQPSVWKTADGNLWFPTSDGIVMIDPDHLETNKLPPPVHIEQMMVDGQPVSSDRAKESKIGAGAEKLEFNYTALSFAEPENVEFRYKLEGYDLDWVDAGKRRTAFYTHIPPGHYSFKVVASNNDQVWNETGASLLFFLQPHFYQTIWFYSLCGLMVTAGAFAFHRQKMKRASVEFAAVLSERHRIAREIHDTLAQALAGVVMQLETARLLPSKEKAEQHLNRALELARKSVTEARRTIGDLRPEPLSTQDFPDSMNSLAREQLQESGLKLQFHTTGDPVKLSGKMQAELLRICQESLHNIVKHAGANSVEIALHFQNSQQLRMVIKDNGKGFASDLISGDGHYGIRGMRERAYEIGAQFNIQSRLHAGTEIEVIVPLT